MFAITASELVLSCTSCGQILETTNDIAYQTFETNVADARPVDTFCNNCYEMAREAQDEFDRDRN